MLKAQSAGKAAEKAAGKAVAASLALLLVVGAEAVAQQQPSGRQPDQGQGTQPAPGGQPGQGRTSGGGTGFNARQPYAEFEGFYTPGESDCDELRRVRRSGGALRFDAQSLQVEPTRATFTVGVATSVCESTSGARAAEGISSDARCTVMGDQPGSGAGERPAARTPAAGTPPPAQGAARPGTTTPPQGGTPAQGATPPQPDQRAAATPPAGGRQPDGRQPDSGGTTRPAADRGTGDRLWMRFENNTRRLVTNLNGTRRWWDRCEL